MWITQEVPCAQVVPSTHIYPEFVTSSPAVHIPARKLSHVLRPARSFIRFGNVHRARLEPLLPRVLQRPAEVYERLKHLGMSIVTITDHDSIDAVETLRRYPDFFLSEEVSVQMPSGTEMHLGVYGIAERDHVEIQRRRSDFISLMMYFTERKLFF